MASSVSSNPPAKAVFNDFSEFVHCQPNKTKMIAIGSLALLAVFFGTCAILASTNPELVLTSDFTASQQMASIVICSILGSIAGAPALLLTPLAIGKKELPEDKHRSPFKFQPKAATTTAVV